MLFDTPEDGFGAERFPTAAPTAATPAPAAPTPQSEAALDAIRKEGLTGRQLRLARRLAQRHNLPATSDYDAVRLLREAGLDPFNRAAMLDAVSAEAAPPLAPPMPIPGDSVKLPQTIRPAQVPSTETRPEVNQAAEIGRMQHELARRRRKRLALLFTRLGFFVGLPTLVAAWYFYLVATPLYATKSEFVIQQSDKVGGSNFGGLFSGTQFATSQDSIAVQGYLQSRDAMLRLDEEIGFRAAFKAEEVDPITRLDPDATDESAYKTYKRNVRISYDPTEGLIKMEVIAPDPEVSAAWSRQLISYAEEQVDQLTQRLREDQMKGAREAYAQAETAMLAAQTRVVDLQERSKVLSAQAETALVSQQIGALETQLTQDRLSLAQMESNASPNRARMDPLIRRIAVLESEISELRNRMSEGSNGGESLARIQGELLVAEADVQTRQMLLAQSLQALETARVEANRQVRYLSLAVSPTPPDEPTYPRAFENTLVTLFVFLGIYLMITMTVAILREQVTS
jgi:capsular polysaccharide transport system permease protein